MGGGCWTGLRCPSAQAEAGRPGWGPPAPRPGGHCPAPPSCRSVSPGAPPSHLCSPPCGPSTSLLHRDPPSHTQLPDFTRASVLSPLSILPPTPETSTASSAPLDTPASQNKSSSLGLTRPCPHGGCWRPSSEMPSALSSGNPSPSPEPRQTTPPPPPGPVAGRRGARPPPPQYPHPDLPCPLPPARPHSGGACPSLWEVGARDPTLPHHSLILPPPWDPPSAGGPQFCPPLGLRKPWGPQSSSPALEP